MKLPDNENLTAVREKILPVLKKYRAVLAVLLAGVLLLASGHSGNTEQVQSRQRLQERQQHEQTGGCPHNLF